MARKKKKKKKEVGERVANETNTKQTVVAARHMYASFL